MTERGSWKEIAEQVDRDIGEGRENVDIKPVKAKVSPGADAVFSVRMSYSDMALLRRYTQRKGIKMSEFARDALLKAIAEDENDDPLTGLLASAQQLARLAHKVEVSIASPTSPGLDAKASISKE